MEGSVRIYWTTGRRKKKRGGRGIGRVVRERKGCKERVERNAGGREESVKLRPSRDFL